MSGEPIDDGGSAFPLCVPDYHGDRPHLQNGMSLRDWFAGMATELDIRTYEGGRYQRGDGIWTTTTREKARYIYADAMIAARKGGAK